MKKVTFIILSLILTSLSFSQSSMPKKGDFDLKWIMPKALSNPLIMTFERMEVGLNLPDSIDRMIQNFIKDSVSTSKLNPFNPEDIDIKADFYIRDGENWKLKQFVYAFYYEDFRRNTQSKKVDDWNWIKLKTKDNFRIRFAPTQAGKWKFTVSIKIRGKEVAKLGDYEFSCTSDGNPGFVKVSENKRYFKLGENVFFPVGQNLPRATCYFEKDSLGKVKNDEYKCADCSCAGYEEWCPHLRKLPINPNAYMAYLKELEKLSKTGANFYRVLIFPHTYDFEYDKLGNYYSRLNCAWELDQVVQKSEQLGLKMDLNLFVGYAVAKSPYDVKAWDWAKENENDFGYCYKSELHLNETVEFLTNPEALKHYKNKLRYIIARWGYSTAIAQLEMMSEINNKFQKFPKEMYSWHYEVTKYIKEDLGHKNQLLAVSYDGTSPQESLGDSSFSIPYVDVITHNVHRINVPRKDVQNYFKRYSYHNKPFIYSEIGTGDTGVDGCDNQVEWQKDLWTTIFSGTASAGINWNEHHNYKLWENFKYVQTYVKDINFDEFTELGNKLRKDELVEVLFLTTKDGSKNIGMVHNLTWNYYTNSTNGVCKKDFIPKNKAHLSFTETPFLKKKKGLKLSNLKSKTLYVIEWFDPFTGITIKTEEIQTKMNGTIVLNHPTLDKKTPFVAYKLYPKGVVFTTLKPVEKQTKATKSSEIKIYNE